MVTFGHEVTMKTIPIGNQMDQMNTCCGKENGRGERSRPSVDEKQYDLKKK